MFVGGFACSQHHFPARRRVGLGPVAAAARGNGAAALGRQTVRYQRAVDRDAKVVTERVPHTALARTHRRKPGDRLAEVIRVGRLISREHVSAVAVAAAVHQGRVRVPCASSATLGNSTERVNGGLELCVAGFERPFLVPGRGSQELSFWGWVENAAREADRVGPRLSGPTERPPSRTHYVVC
eukprot:scaffold83961_cov36-Phaeocystis_antarctica.AAC.1